MEKIISYKEKSPLDPEMPLSVQPSYGIGIVDNAISADVTDEEDSLIKRKLDFVLMPLLGFCYMLHFWTRQLSAIRLSSVSSKTQ